MTWTLLFGLVFALGIVLLVAAARRAELARMASAVQAHEEAERHGGAKAQLQHPIIDLSRCLGCGTCVSVCPEEGVLELVHGQAKVVRGARCMGIAACARECPVDAITVTMVDTAERDDIPAIDENLEVVGRPGLFLAGEVTAHALIKVAIEHGTRIAAEVASRIEVQPPADDAYDLLIVGAGPAGLACALEAQRQDLRYVVLEKESAIGGTVATYPRRKLVLTQPVEMPLVGTMKERSYTKEDLMGMWSDVVAEHDLQIEFGARLRGVEQDGDDYVVESDAGTFRARNVCIAVGRRGVPRKLGVPGEELSKVSYSLLDAASYTDLRLLVVGGGDSAVEAALALAEQPGNSVTLAYRKGGFFRLKSKNAARIEEAIGDGTVKVKFDTEVLEIRHDAVVLETAGKKYGLHNDEVFVMIGGEPPIELLTRAGVSFDPALREAPLPPGEQGVGLRRAAAAGFVMTALALAFALLNLDYYGLEPNTQPTHDKHNLLRPGLGLGLGMGIAATALIAVNLLYLWRRSPRFRFAWGSLQAWMTSHIATGVLALLLAMLHAAMRPENTPGGHAFWALVVLTVTGAVGRYFYAWLPRAANGRELSLLEMKQQLARVPEEWNDGYREFRQYARGKVSDLIERKRWHGSLAGRVAAMLGARGGLRRVLRDVQAEGRIQGVPEERIFETLDLARAAHRDALVVAHFEDLRAVLNTWRYLHRWVAALMVLLLAVHIVHALIYGGYFSARGYGG